MTITEALNIAGENGKIVRTSDVPYGSEFYLQATNTHSRIVMFSDGEQLGIRWEPTFDDLVAKDWTVVEKGETSKGWNRH